MSDSVALLTGPIADDPAAAAAALRAAGATRVVLALERPRPSGDLLAALRRAGAEPFGIETVAVDGRTSEEADVLVAAATAKLDALPPGERGRPGPADAPFSRRLLFSLRGPLTELPVAALDPAACSGCGLCVDACPAGAIAAGLPVPTVDVRACGACGLCVARCPEGALRLTGASLEQLEAQLDELIGRVDGVVLACRRARAQTGPGVALVELPTLGVVTPGWLLQLRARGLAVRLAPCDGACCAGTAAVEELAECYGVAPRRGPLALGEPRATAEALAGADGPDLLEAGASPLGLVELAPERCTLCTACTTACPTHALSLAEEVDATALRLDPTRCVGCGRCATACPEDALDVRRGIDLARLAQDALVLARVARERCGRCGADLPPAPLRRRLRDLLPERAAAPLDLCARCAAAPFGRPAAG